MTCIESIPVVDFASGVHIGEIVPCERCNSYSAWWTADGVVKCQRCDRKLLDRSRRWLASADRIRQTTPAINPSDTRREAGRQIERHVGECEKRVLAVVRAAGASGLIDEQIAEVAEMSENTSRSRRVTLRDRGEIVDSGSRRRTKARRSAIVWIAREFQGSH